MSRDALRCGTIPVVVNRLTSDHFRGSPRGPSYWCIPDYGCQGPGPQWDKKRLDPGRKGTTADLVRHSTRIGLRAQNHMFTLRLLLFVACGWLLLSQQAGGAGIARRLAERLHISTPPVNEISFQKRLDALWLYDSRGYSGDSLRALLASANLCALQTQGMGIDEQTKAVYDWCRDMAYFALVVELEDNLAERKDHKSACGQILKMFKRQIKSSAGLPRALRTELIQLVELLRRNTHETELSKNSPIQRALRMTMDKGEQCSLIDLAATLLANFFVDKYELELFQARRKHKLTAALAQVAEFLRDLPIEKALDICKWMLKIQPMVSVGNQDLLMRQLREFFKGFVINKISPHLESDEQRERLFEVSLSQNGDWFDLRLVFNDLKGLPPHGAANFWNPATDRGRDLGHKLGKIHNNLPRACGWILENIVRELQFRKIVLSGMRGACFPATIPKDLLHSETLYQIGLYLQETSWGCLDEEDGFRCHELGSHIREYQKVRAELIKVSGECFELRDREFEGLPEEWYVDLEFKSEMQI